MMMNPVKGEVPLVLSDKRTFTLVLDMEALVEAEAAYRKPLAQMMADASAGFLGAQAAMLQGALSRHHNVTRGEALDMLRTDLEPVVAALSAAGQAAFPDATGEPGNGAPPPAGKTSGASGAKRASTPKVSGKSRRARSR